MANANLWPELVPDSWKDVLFGKRSSCDVHTLTLVHAASHVPRNTDIDTARNGALQYSRPSWALLLR